MKYIYITKYLHEPSVKLWERAYLSQVIRSSNDHNKSWQRGNKKKKMLLVSRNKLIAMYSILVRYSHFTRLLHHQEYLITSNNKV